MHPTFVALTLNSSPRTVEGLTEGQDQLECRQSKLYSPLLFEVSCPPLSSESLRRMPHAPWFSLIGSIDKDKNSCFLIGTDKNITAPKTGRLYCFANDVIIAYGNNQGSIELTVTRLT